MQSQTSAADPFRHLGAQTIEITRRLCPPVGVIHVSADNGGAAFRRWSDLAIPNVWLFSASPTGGSQLRDLVAKTPGWAAEHVLLGDQEVDSTDFFVTSNPTANGPIAPEYLRPLWPNLRILETLQLLQRRLDRFLDARYAETAAQANWLVIDCLPALPVLEGAGRYLDQMDLISVRVVLDPADQAIDRATLPELADFLVPRGFRQVAITEDINPALGEAVFIRDWRSCGASRAAILTQERDAQVKLTAERQVQLAKVTQERDAQATLAAERQAQLDKLTQERDAQVKLVEERQAQLAKVTQERDAQAKLAAERLTQVEQLTQRTKSQEQEISKLKQQGERSAQLEAQLLDLDNRQQLANEEMIRAEAQLDLIKDLLLRDSGM